MNGFGKEQQSGESGQWDDNGVVMDGPHDCGWLLVINVDEFSISKSILFPPDLKGTPEGTAPMKAWTVKFRVWLRPPTGMRQFDFIEATLQ